MNKCDCGYWGQHEDYCDKHPLTLLRAENEELRDLIDDAVKEIEDLRLELEKFRKMSMHKEEKQ
jgi:hypothetical protein